MKRERKESEKEERWWRAYGTRGDNCLVGENAIIKSDIDSRYRIDAESQDDASLPQVAASRICCTVCLFGIWNTSGKLLFKKCLPRFEIFTMSRACLCK